MGTTDQNKAVIQRFLEAWNNRRPEVFDELVASDVVRHCEATPGVEVKSLAQLKDFMRQDSEIFPDSRQTITLAVAEGDFVAVWAQYEGTQRGPIGPLPPSGRKVRFDFGAVFRLENGKIAEWWATWDNMTVLRKLGHLPAISAGFPSNQRCLDRCSPFASRPLPAVPAATYVPGGG